MLTFLIDNHLEDATLSLSSGTENAQFPLSNIKNTATVKKFRSTSNTCKIVVDMLQTREINSIAIHGDSTKTLGITSAKVRFSLNTDFSGYTAEDITLSGDYAMGYLLRPNSVSYRYAEFEFSGNGDFVEVSNLYLGKREELELNGISVDSFKYSFEENSTTSENDYGQAFTNIRNKVKLLSGSINTCTKAEQDQLETIFLYHRTIKPLWVLVDTESVAVLDGNYKLTIYGRLTKIPDWQGVNGNHWNTSLTIKQVV